MNIPRLVFKNFTSIEPDNTVKRVFIKRNAWDNYGLFVGTKKVYDAGEKYDITDYIAKKYPRAEIIDKTTNSQPCSSQGTGI